MSRDGWQCGRSIRAWPSPVYRGRAPEEPGEAVLAFWVIDGLRASEPVPIRIRVLP